jgi:hypothetical protein
MIIFAKMAIKYPQLSDGAIRLTDYGSWVWNNDEKYYTEAKAELAELGVTNWDSFQQLIKDLDSVVYTLKDLKKDLKLLQVPFEAAYLRHH